ncbi:MAG: RNA-binding S4 domain-containing protein [Bacteroidales bacterium]
MEALRIDKWLWSVRLFKTRTIATDACRTGRIRIEGDAVKPSREIRPGHEISLHMGPFTKTVKVIGLPKSRVGAKLVPDYMLDLTPSEEYLKLEMLKENPFAQRKGRPTKKERRDMDEWFGWEE